MADPSNSQPSCTDSNSPRRTFRPRQGGLDTIGIVFTWDTEEDWKTWEERISLRHRHFRSEEGLIQIFGNPARKLTAARKLPGGIRFGFLPRSSGVWVEGRMSAMLTGEREVRDLMPAAFLKVAVTRAGEDLSALLSPLDFPDGLFLDASVSFNRLDFAADISCDPPAGLEALRGLSHLALAGERPLATWGKKGQIETVYLAERSKKTRMRIYDKATQADKGPAGSIIRFERELRWQGRDRIPLDAANHEFLQAKWLDGLAPWFGSKPLAEPVIQIYPLDEAADKIIGQAESGALTFEAAERLLGSLLIRRRRSEGWWKEQGHKDAGYRRSRQLKALGINVGPVESRIGLGEALRAAEKSIAEPRLIPGLVPVRKDSIVPPVPW
jgi:hypothetical protein